MTGAEDLSILAIQNTDAVFTDLAFFAFGAAGTTVPTGRLEVGTCVVTNGLTRLAISNTAALRTLCASRACDSITWINGSRATADTH